jgi:phosphomannomutase
LQGFKKLKGKIVVSFSVTNKLKKLADYYGLETIVTKIGFKYIAEYMVSDDVLVAGEESGGLAIKGHIPERDGIWIGLTILEFIAKTGKSITELIQEIYEITGQFCL